MKEAKISIAKIVGGGICVAAEDGNRVHDAIRDEIEKGNRVAISFSGITRLTTAFLNAAIGQLYGEYPDDRIRQQLAPPENAEAWQLTRLKLVVDRAKVFFRDPEAVKRALARATGQNDD
jgi:hypothetical protein